MNTEKQIKSWLNGSLKEQELEDFKQTETFKSLQRIESAAQLFKAPEFDKIASQASINSIKKVSKQNKQQSLFYKIAGLAAIFILGLFVTFQWVFNTTTTIETAANQEEVIVLPDQSKVYLNSNSKLSYSQTNFEKNRTLKLEGEAFFIVEKGTTFMVSTPISEIEVLGTSFNVKSRASFTEVDCYTGSVKVVDYQNNQAILTSLQRFANYNGQFKTSNLSKKEPGWIGQNKSSFYKTPLHIVLNELATQYQVQVNADAVDTSIYFSGSFIHGNLEEALNAIALPLQISFKIEENQVTLQKD